MDTCIQCVDAAADISSYPRAYERRMRWCYEHPCDVLRVPWRNYTVDIYGTGTLCLQSGSGTSTAGFRVSYGARDVAHEYSRTIVHGTMWRCVVAKAHVAKAPRGAH